MLISNRIKISLLLPLFAWFSVLSQESSLNRDVNRNELKNISLRYSEEYEQGKAGALEVAGNNGLPLRKQFQDGRTMELQYIDILGFPVYHTTFNSEAAATVTTNQVHPGGGAGLDLTGSGYFVGIWDAGVVDTSHREFKGRLLIKNDFEKPDDHATHVAGTIAAEGLNESAKGMAFEAELLSFNWNNYLSEVSGEAAKGLLISNHSYGISLGWTKDNGEWVWNGDPNARRDYRFGFYSSQQSYQLDYIATLAPNLLMVWSAGNYRSGVGDGTKEPNGPFNCIGPESIAKNVLAVGAVEKIIEGYSLPSDVVLTDFSSWGPTDDGRVKPDLVAPGKDLFSANLNNSYRVSSGTSMSAPVAAGSLLLLQELYDSLTGSPMRSATLKALAIHTVFETGVSPGPDYQYGWGMLNTSSAAEIIINYADPGVYIEELTLEGNDTIEFTLYSDGTSPITATMAWTDIPGTPVHPDSLHLSNLMLVNDLDLRIRSKSGDQFFPWILDPENPALPAERGDNFRDNVEKILLEDPDPREYILSISHKGNLTGTSQDFSLIVTASVLSRNDAGTLYWIGGEGDWHDPGNWSVTSGGLSAGALPNPGVNVVFDENSFLSGMHNITIDQDARCRSFSWLVKEENGIDFTGNDIFVYGDFLVSNGIFAMEGDGRFVFEGEGGIISTGRNLGYPYSFIFNNESGNWVAVSDINIGEIILKGGHVDLSGRGLNLGSFTTEGGGYKYLNLSGSDVYIYDIIDLTGDNFHYEAEKARFFVDPATAPGQAVIKADQADLYSIEVVSGTLLLDGNMTVESLLNRSSIILDGDNIFMKLVLWEGSETWLAGNSDQIVYHMEINSDPSEIVTIHSLSDQLASLNGPEYVKFCFDYLDIYNVTASGKALFVAGVNSLLSGNTSGWIEGICDDVLFAGFDFEYPCANGHTRFIDRSDGNITGWHWDFGDGQREDDTSTLSNPHYTYRSPGIYDVTLTVEDMAGSAALTREIEISENSIAENEIFINIFGTFVSTQTAPHYQWYNNDVPIPGANNRTLPSSGDVDRVRVLLTDEQCNRFSNTIIVSAGDVQNDKAQLLLYPNPAVGVIYIDFTDDHSGRVFFEIIDITGKVLKSYSEPKTGPKLITAFSTAELAPGVYYLRMTAGSEITVRSFIKK